MSLKTQSDNLEDIYMELDERSRNELTCKTVKEKLENCIRDYMSSYKIPCKLTVYDFLIMSLTAKDLIVTFNWDPLLVQAVGRIKFNCNYSEPYRPKIMSGVPSKAAFNALTAFMPFFLAVPM